MFADFKVGLRSRLAGPLPADKAHQKMMRHRKSIDQLGGLSKDARKSAVLLLLYPKNGILNTVFIQRPIYEGVHSGQIALPGGKLEKTDQSLQAAAFREADEELNIKPNDLEFIGQLTPLYVPPSNFIIHPFIAFQDSIPEFKADPMEVQSFIECPIHQFVGDDKIKETSVTVRGSRLKTMAFSLEEHIIWGATGMILKEFTDLIATLRLPGVSK